MLFQISLKPLYNICTLYVPNSTFTLRESMSNCMKLYFLDFFFGLLPQQTKVSGTAFLAYVAANLKDD